MPFNNELTFGIVNKQTILIILYLVKLTLFVQQFTIMTNKVRYIL